MSVTDTAFVWTDQFLLGYGPMDATHREFVDLVGAMLSAPDAELAGHLDAFADHAVRHFDEERVWMEGSAFPATKCHNDEHAAVLASVREVQQLLADGEDPQVCRALAHALTEWFPGHADYMDAALSQWMVKHKMGGVPIVLRRSAPGEATV